MSPVLVGMYLKRIALLTIALYLLGGFLLLPSSNFSSMIRLPQMYNHCKATEDKEITVLDFVTEHLLGIDGNLEKRE